MEMKLALKKRTPVGLWLQLDDSEPFDTLIAQLLVKIDSALHPSVLSIDHYDVKFSIPRLSPAPMALTDNESYGYMLSRAIRSKDPNVVLVIEAVRVPEPEITTKVRRESAPS